MRLYLKQLIEELKRLKEEGIQHVVVAEESLEALRRVVFRTPCTERAPAMAGMQLASPESLTAVFEKEKAVEEPIRVKRVEHGGIPVASFKIAPIPEPPVVALPEGEKRIQWEWLKKRVLDCPVCHEHVRPGKKVVFGVGNLEADIFFCGEAPGADEEMQGVPFVGRAGQLLTRMIQAMGLSREEVYIGNIMNWRPEKPIESGNRPPTQEEMRFCLPYLRAQLAVVQPKVIVALGATAMHGLLGAEMGGSVGKSRGRWFTFSSIPLRVTYHPSYLIRYATKRNKRFAWEDMLAVMEKLGMPVSEKQRNYFL